MLAERDLEYCRYALDADAAEDPTVHRIRETGDVADTEVLPLLAQKTSACQLVARMGVGINKSGKARYVDLFDLAPAVSAEGVLGAFHDLPSLPGDDGDGLAPLCCQHLHLDEMGQLQAKFESQTRLIGGAMCMFRVRAEPEASMLVWPTCLMYI